METSADSAAWNQEIGGNGAPLTEQAKKQAGQVMQQTREAASRVADQAVQQVKTQIEAGKERATGGLEEVSQALHETSQTLRERNQEIISHYAETGAELVDQVSSYFRDRNVERIVDDVEEFGRRQAGLFLGGAFALGFILSRFLKSSSPNGHVRSTYSDTRRDGYASASGTAAEFGGG